MTDAPRTGGDSGLLVPIPEAEPVVGELRLRHDPVAAAGIPAHVTVLFPYVPRAEIDDPLRAALADLFGSLPGFAFRFDRVERFGDSTVFLAPEPAGQFSALIAAAASRWPEHPPYGGVFETVIPHLTVGDDLAPGEADALVATLRGALDRSGPITGSATAVLLVTEDETGRWRTDAAFPLASGARGAS
ncbi:MAG TPA: 2'-5' RNA ligase family protein [Candidatus Limnocylindrales bacterium]|nr:2'-5' RNA ligase family protein [Candidatus Limnocylindrales bacterium]